MFYRFNSGSRHAVENFSIHDVKFKHRPTRPKFEEIDQTDGDFHEGKIAAEPLSVTHHIGPTSKYAPKPEKQPQNKADIKNQRRENYSKNATRKESRSRRRKKKRQKSWLKWM